MTFFASALTRYPDWLGGLMEKTKCPLQQITTHMEGGDFRSGLFGEGVSHFGRRAHIW